MSEEEGTKIVSDNKIASDNTIKNSLINFEPDFSGLKDTVALFFPSIRHEMILRYRAETIAKIGIEAYKMAESESIQINPIPPKIALPLIEKMSLEHEPDMYEKWAKLLIATGVNPNPIYSQYAYLLSNLDNESSNFLKAIYTEQKKKENTEAVYEQYIEHSMFNKIFDFINKRVAIRFSVDGEKEESIFDDSNIDYPSFTFPMIIYGTEESVRYHWVVVTEKNKNEKINPKNHQSPCLILSKKDEMMLQLLVKLGLIKFQVLSTERIDKVRSEDGKKYLIDRYGVFLTEFGYSFIDCLEHPVK
jgi:hypothetical protein